MVNKYWINLYAHIHTLTTLIQFICVRLIIMVAIVLSCRKTPTTTFQHKWNIFQMFSIHLD
jgi:hypothetical protein